MRKLTLPLKKHKQNLILTVVASALLLGGLFFFSLRYLHFNLPIEKRYEVAGNLVAIFHALFCFISVSLVLNNKIKESTWEYLLAFTQGYFIYDFIIVLLFPDVTHHNTMHQIVLLIHHTSVFFISFSSKARALLKIGFLSEIALPFLYMSLSIKVIQPKYMKTKAFMVLGGVTLALYFIMRVCLFTYVLWKSFMLMQDKYKTTNSPKIMSYHIFTFLLFLGVTLLNYFWFYRLVTISLKALQKG